MSDKKVRINEELLNKIKQIRKNKDNSVIYPSDKYFVQIAILELLKKFESEKKIK
ncbi:MAG: hypothetical protein WCX73_02325 [Candidatus Pacearchaeota archaeon]|jgi:hypothetical protein